MNMPIGKDYLCIRKNVMEIIKKENVARFFSNLIFTNRFWTFLEMSIFEKGQSGL